MQIRPALAAEEVAVTTLWRACGLAMPWNDIEAEFRLALGSANSDILVAVIEQQVVGSVMVGHEGHRGWLYYVATDPAWRGQGVARGRGPKPAGYPAFCHNENSWLAPRQQ